MAGKKTEYSTLNNLKKQLDQIVGELQTIQRNIAAMREAGKSAKQIYKEYGKELEKLRQMRKHSTHQLRKEKMLQKAKETYSRNTLPLRMLPIESKERLLSSFLTLRIRHTSVLRNQDSLV